MNRAVLVFSLALLAACAPGSRRTEAKVLTGLDVLQRDGFAPLKGKRIGLIGNHTSYDARGRSVVEVLGASKDVNLVALFSPEHGFTGVSEENRIGSSSLSFHGRQIPVYSLYEGGMAGMRPKPEQLQNLDALVFDIQDIGARFYTYLTTMGMAMEEAAKAGLEFYVLDRPNPINGLTMEGPVLDDLSLRQVTVTAYFPVPVRHGMTAGEIATMHNAEIKGKLTVVKMEGWNRAMWYDQTGLPWIAPSPNMPDLEAATLYPGVAIFESSNLAVGRGTPIPFRWVGAPWMDGERVAREAESAHLAGVRFSSQDFTPTKSVFKDQPCHGVKITITDRESLRPIEVFRVLERSIRGAHPKDFVWRWNEAKRMVGTENFQKLVEAGGDPTTIETLLNKDARPFESARAPFLLY